MEHETHETHGTQFQVAWRFCVHSSGWKNSYNKCGANIVILALFTTFIEYNKTAVYKMCGSDLLPLFQEWKLRLKLV